jgi:REP element-mobilizing transposase RayT
VACGGLPGRPASENLPSPATLSNCEADKASTPHLYIPGQPLFITFRLRDSLPPNRPFPPCGLTSGEAFLALDRLVDHARSGPAFLRQPAIAEIVLVSIEYGSELEHYRIHSWVIMPNHVHLLLTPLVAVSRLLGSLKSSTAKQANPMLHRTGQAFWQDESYDHLVRNGDEFRRIQGYIENNPVTAGLETRPQDYAWSSAGRPGRPPQAKGLPHSELKCSNRRVSLFHTTFDTAPAAAS